MSVQTISAKHHDLLVHMLGCGDHIPKRSRGYRNRFCAVIGDDDYRSMNEMLIAGLVTAGCKINQGTMQFFHATKEGAQAIGLKGVVLKRAFAD